MKLTKEQTDEIARQKASIPKIPIPPLEGSLDHHKDFPSDLIRPRPVDVWLPEGYDEGASEQYPVIYMHDGQMLIHHADSSLAGMDVFWDVDKVMTRLIRNEEIRRAIVVSVWMAEWAEGARGEEYMPQKAVSEEVWQRMQVDSPKWSAGTSDEVLSSDSYLKFLVTELKHFIDDSYRTLTDSANTFVMGSSMGGLISAYAIAEYPGVFGGAACMSTDWTIGEGTVARWLSDHWPAPGRNRIYFDYGTETMDAHYEPYQKQMDECMRDQGYTESQDWMTRRFEGADHSPKSWNARLHVPLKFLLGNTRTTLP
ncbi:MAG: esterase [Gammaproteobacteria bacterium]|uniref:Esterase n=1 Tax=OM182 bacterium MED-G24 TaxID=1986255 RepID=A0A2A5WUL3_9GAMM|nr:esterase [Gammaproteobacteria bacterium]PDH40250.1 MAG: esterase [OM182 bacterium MED-G24]RPG23337.1 MAG: esterase [Gammaproteobacteria bacterium TMED50]|tara:strand:+ start:17319 stop:18254 length:936 start_codon:yes stop_codon:yes gene_type:complete